MPKQKNMPLGVPYRKKLARQYYDNGDHLPAKKGIAYYPLGKCASGGCKGDK